MLQQHIQQQNSAFDALKRQIQEVEEFTLLYQIQAIAIHQGAGALDGIF
jgi:hypothetical protein